jgi:hypothetical protein
MSVEAFSNQSGCRSVASLLWSRPARRAGQGLLVLAGLAAFLGCVGGQARPPDEDKEKAAPPAKVAVKAVPRFSDENFDQWVFQQDRNAAGARKRMAAQLALQAEDLDRTCGLTDEQKAKLELAGKGDIKRFFDLYEAIKQKFQLLKNDEQKLDEIFQNIRPLQMTMLSGLFHEDSLLHKSLRSTLTEEQLARYDAVVQERRAFRHRANVELAVTTIEQALPLRDAQRRELITLITSHIKPPRRAGPYEFYLIMCRVGRIPEEKLKPLFDDAQWKGVERIIAQYKDIERSLKQAGQVVDEDEPEKPAAPLEVKK